LVMLPGSSIRSWPASSRTTWPDGHTKRSGPLLPFLSVSQSKRRDHIGKGWRKSGLAKTSKTRY
jgi:hypothetical protein